MCTVKVADKFDTADNVILFMSVKGNATIQSAANMLLRRSNAVGCCSIWADALAQTLCQTQAQTCIQPLAQPQSRSAMWPSCHLAEHSCTGRQRMTYADEFHC